MECQALRVETKTHYSINLISLSEKISTRTTKKKKKKSNYHMTFCQCLAPLGWIIAVCRLAKLTTQMAFSPFLLYLSSASHAHVHFHSESFSKGSFFKGTFTPFMEIPP